MSEYIGTVGTRTSFEAVYKRCSEYMTHFSFRGENHSVYQFEDDNGNIIVWDTTSGFVEDKKMNRDKNGMLPRIWKGARLLIKATVKDHSEYKGAKQTKISRPTFTLIENGKSPEEIQKEKDEYAERRKREQLESIKEGDIIWEMPYKQYKEHYSDCETIYESFKNEEGFATIEVIIRAGRLKNSGTRGRHFYGFSFAPSADYETGTTYRAVSEENARKRMIKEHPERESWVLVRIYDYRKAAGRI